MGINHRVEIEGCGRHEALCGVKLQGVIVRAGQEGLGVERIKGEVCDAKFMRRGAFAGSGGGFVGVSIKIISCALQIP